MIYDAVKPQEDIRQGDIFLNIPFVEFNLEQLNIIINNKVEEKSWKDISNEEVNVIANLNSTNGIIISQDCDCLREPDITLAIVSKWNKDYQSAKKWMLKIIGLNRSESKIYLPIDTDFKIQVRSHIEFSSIFSLPRKNLYSLRDSRVCRLNSEALEHFKQKIGYYFSRYAFYEHYPLNKEEMDEYKKWRSTDTDETYVRREYQE